MNKQNIVTPSGIGLVAVLRVGQLSWLVKLWLLGSSPPLLKLLGFQASESLLSLVCSIMDSACESIQQHSKVPTPEFGFD